MGTPGMEGCDNMLISQFIQILRDEIYEASGYTNQAVVHAVTSNYEVGDRTLHEVVRCNVMIKRNGSIATTVVELINKTTSITISEPNGRVIDGDYDEVGDVNAVLSANFYYNEMRLAITLGGSAFDGTIDIFNIIRLNL
jgi:hypothetical protein